MIILVIGAPKEGTPNLGKPSRSEFAQEKFRIVRCIRDGLPSSALDVARSRVLGFMFEVRG